MVKLSALPIPPPLVPINQYALLPPAPPAPPEVFTLPHLNPIWIQISNYMPPLNHPLLAHVRSIEARNDVLLLPFNTLSPPPEYSGYYRPPYRTPRRSDMHLLHIACNVFPEHIVMPPTFQVPTIWLSDPKYAPYGQCPWSRMAELQHILAQITVLQNGGCVAMRALQVYTSMASLERGDLCRLMHTPLLHPRMLTLTVRHVDWWGWERDEPLTFHGDWMDDFGSSLSGNMEEIRLELETLERKSDQLNDVVRLMCHRWFFRRSDGVTLFPDASCRSNVAEHWSGTSRWEDRRWVRDESAPGRLNYYVVTVVFRSLEHILGSGGRVNPESYRRAESDICNADRMLLTPTDPPNALAFPEPGFIWDAAGEVSSDSSNYNESPPPMLPSVSDLYLDSYPSSSSSEYSIGESSD